MSSSSLNELLLAEHAVAAGAGVDGVLAVVDACWCGGGGPQLKGGGAPALRRAAWRRLGLVTPCNTLSCVSVLQTTCVAVRGSGCAFLSLFLCLSVCLSAGLRSRAWRRALSLQGLQGACGTVAGRRVLRVLRTPMVGRSHLTAAAMQKGMRQHPIQQPRQARPPQISHVPGHEAGGELRKTHHSPLPAAGRRTPHAARHTPHATRHTPHATGHYATRHSKAIPLGPGAVTAHLAPGMAPPRGAQVTPLVTLSRAPQPGSYDTFVGPECWQCMHVAMVETRLKYGTLWCTCTGAMAITGWIAITCWPIAGGYPATWGGTMWPTAITG